MDGTITHDPPVAPGEALGKYRSGYSARVWAGATLLAAALGMILLGGIFLMGTMYLVKPELVDPSLRADDDRPAVQTLIVVLYGVAGLCLLGAAILGVLGTRILMRVADETASA